MNKRFQVLVISITIIISLLAGGLVFAENNITVQLDGKTLNFDVQPQLIGGRTMVPLRMIFESMGATVDWNNDTQTVTAYNERYFVQATINDSNMKVNGEMKALDVPPLLVGGRILVPARFVAEAFGAKVDWDGAKSIVYIWSKLNAASESKVPHNFTDGYELADFSKFNSPASENGLGGTKIYLDCIIDKSSIIDTDEGKQIVGYLIDSDKNNWVALLHTTVVVNENEYSSIVGKPLVFCGVYDGYSETEKMPFVYLDELCVKETGAIKSGVGKLMSREKPNNNLPSVSNDSSSIPFYINHPGVPDFGAILNVPLKSSNKTDYVYSLIGLKTADTQRYANILEEVGFMPYKAGKTMFIHKKGNQTVTLMFTDTLLFIVIE